GEGVVRCYFSQQEAELPEQGTLLDVPSRATGLPRPQAQNLLGRFLFSGWEAHEKTVTALSRGERTPLAPAAGAAPRACRRRAGAPVSVAFRRLGRELPRPRRADEPPRPGEPRGPRGGARRF